MFSLLSVFENWLNQLIKWLVNNNNQYYGITEVIYLVFLRCVVSWGDKVQILKGAQMHFAIEHTGYRQKQEKQYKVPG